ncbi:cytochrome c-type biogenesis protein [Halomonas halocynthiae]|uniref:cytochrome c-type biogenesis protein n=1 Tax=Halomonas halocynthiae TaxID=176290 RepID=UPI000424B12B|nr:cytochrome c-type biogenesis protein [Halomonas halocynthiae]
MASVNRALGLVLLSLAALLSVMAAQAESIEIRQFDNPVTEQRYQSLTASLRCPKCQNQAIDDSDSPIAGDMRDRVYLLLQDGRSDREVLDFMVERFGDYVLYNPRLEGRTMLLWGLPAGLLLVGGLFMILLVRSRRKASVKALSDEERARLDALTKREKIS